MGYSASVEIFGARDRANLNAARYRDVCLRFERALRAAVKDRHVSWFIAGDSCLAESDRIEDLLGWLADVARLGLDDDESAKEMKGAPEEYFAIRAAAIQGDLNISSIKSPARNKGTYGWTVSDETAGNAHAELFESLRSFKGIGVRVDIPNIEGQLFTNAWPTMNSGIPYYLFSDLMPKEKLSVECLNRIVDMSLEANVISRKSSRFYVSGMIRSIKYTNSDSATLKLLHDGIMRATAIAGIELAQLALIGKIFYEPRTDGEPSSVKKSPWKVTDGVMEIRERLARTSKLVNFVRNLQERRIFPEGIVKRDELYRFQYLVANTTVKRDHTKRSE
jgi:hypothetical protein